jgi:hypothetical protein
MKNDMMIPFSDYGKTAIAATKELVEINSKMMGKVLDAQISLANLYVESGEKQLATIQTADDPKEYMAKQTALLEEYSTKLTEAAQVNVKLAQEASDELKGWFEKGVKTADTAVKKAAANASPVAAAPKKPAAKKAPAKKAATTKAAPKAKS